MGDGVQEDRVGKATRLFHDPCIYLKNDAHIEIRRRAVHDLLGSVTGRLLDVGCGDGRIGLSFLGTCEHVTLVDPAGGMLRLAESRLGAERDRVTLVMSDLDSFEAPAFDVVLCLGVLAHVPEPQRAIAKLSRLVRPGGRLCVQLTDHDEPVAQVTKAFDRAKKAVWNRAGYHVHPTRAVDILKLAQDVGFSPESLRQYWVLPPGLRLLPVSWGTRLLHAMYAQPGVSAWGIEKILLLRRRG